MTVAAAAVSSARSPLLIVVVVCIFFYISVVTNGIGALIPEVIRVYQLSPEGCHGCVSDDGIVRLRDVACDLLSGLEFGA